MDVQSAVGLTGAVQVDQAIFTSIRTPMGEGYRIVASSPAIRKDEKQELVQRLPSHGGICESSLPGVALLSFPMASGRHCVAFSQRAGQEHTGRGGRVFTHVLLLNQPQFAAFDCDPFAIHRAVSLTEANRVNLRPPPELQPLELVAQPAGDTRNSTLPGSGQIMAGSAETTLDDTGCARLKYLLAAAMSDEHLVVSRVHDAGGILRRVLQAMPVAMRTNLAASAGLNYSPHRKLQLVLLSDGVNSTPDRADDDIVSYDWHDVPPPVDSRFSAWVAFGGRHWETGGHERLNEIARLLTHERTPKQLALVVSLYQDMKRASEADPTESERLLNTPNSLQQQSRMRPTLLDQLRALLRIGS